MTGVYYYLTLLDYLMLTRMILSAPGL